MDIKSGGWWKWLFVLTISFILLYFAFRGVKWVDFIDGIKSCNIWWISISMIVGVFAFYIRALRWRLLMLPLNPKITRAESYHGITIGYLTNFALPRAGEFARCGVISSTKKASFESVLGTVVVERLIDVIMFFIILIIMLIGMWEKIGGFINDYILESIIGLFSYSSIWVIIIAFGFIFIATSAVYYNRERLGRSKVISKVFNILKGMKAGLVTCLKMDKKWLFIFQTILIWVSYWLMTYATIKAFPQVSELNGFDAMLLMVVGSLGWIIPVQGGIGAYHFIVSIAMSSIYAIPQSTGVILATISHESQAFTMLVCGLISLVCINIGKKKKKKYYKSSEEY